MQEEPSSAVLHSSEEGKTATLIYILYLGGLVLGITALIGLVMAYVYRDGAPAWVESHYHFQIRTFWIGLFYIVIGSLLSFVFIGYFILLFWFVWLVIRCVKGLKLVGEGRGMVNAETWFW